MRPGGCRDGCLCSGGGGHLLLVLGVFLRRRLRCGCQRLAIGGKQGVDLLLVDPRQHVLVGVDRVAGGEDRRAVVPEQRRDVEEGFGLRRKRRQNRLEQNGKQAEEVYGIAAGCLQFAFAARLARQFPGLDAIHVLIGEIGEGHDLADRLAELARLVVFGDQQAAFAYRLDRR
ncbi:MAG: hypothetical protein AW07_00087 [Candidatus Accumulibacter sp. SK-11]|nr:MAG: hypothetical protein AW07_00087 [Candidatus Accumulibacter sp. SK-11]